jgi:hypothetical protein
MTQTSPTPNAAPPNPYAYTPPVDDTSWRLVRNMRVGLTLLLAVLGIRAFGAEYGPGFPVNGIATGIHEFGHIMFMPFGFPVLGEMMVTLGGSLFEFVFPLIFVGYFLKSSKHRDRHAAMVCLWWAAMNLIHVAIYVADSRAGMLPLLDGSTGQDEGTGHDWKRLLWQWGVLQRDTIYAGRMRGVAGILFFISIVAGVWFAWKPPAPKESE